MIELTDEQQQQLDSGQVVDVADARTIHRYVIVRKDVFEQARRLLFDDADWTDDELRLQLARSAQDNGWNEPDMDAYDCYDEELRKRCP